MNAKTSTRARFVEIRLTMATLYDVKAGDIIQGYEHLGPVKTVKLASDGCRNALVIGRSGRDVLELPKYITVER